MIVQTVGIITATTGGSSEDALLKQALEMSMQPEVAAPSETTADSSAAAAAVQAEDMPDLSAMSEEEQIAFAMQMSLSNGMLASLII